MKKIQVKDKAHIKQLLNTDCILGIKGDQYKSFGGFQLWWYDKERGVCDRCDSHWSDPRKKLVHYNLDKAAAILWRHRNSLYMRTKHSSEDREFKHPLKLLIQPGDAKVEDLGELFIELSILYRMMGGSGINFVVTGAKETAFSYV